MTGTQSGEGVLKFDLDWHDDAACRGLDLEIFFPLNDDRTPEAKFVCSTCPVQTECLEYAMEAKEKWGTWGGLTEKERRSLARRRRLGNVI
jgi:WhiB family redox-sensing transcriptional regulator